VFDVLSATKRSPFGATRTTRGFFTPDAIISTVKPAGTIGFAPDGIGAVLGKFAADGVSIGAGRSCGVRRRRTPGLSSRQPPNAAVPFSTAVLCFAGRQ
jgi:hypothetical protein